MKRRVLGAIAIAIFAGLTGCGKDKNAKEVGAMNTSNIQRLANMYSAFQNQKGRGPKSEVEFKEFITGYDTAKLEMMGIKDAGAIFVSDRDSKPFKIRFNVGGGRGSVDAVVFEAEGQAGTKQVGYTGGRVEDVDESSYAQLWAGKGKDPAGPVGGPPSGPGGRPTGPPSGAPTGPPGGM